MRTPQPTLTGRKTKQGAVTDSLQLVEGTRFSEVLKKRERGNSLEPGRSGRF